MDKIWYRKPSKSEVIGRCDGDEKNEWPRWIDESKKKIRSKKWYVDQQKSFQIEGFKLVIHLESSAFLCNL